MSVTFTSTAGFILTAMLLIQVHQNSRTEHLFNVLGGILCSLHPVY